MNNNIFKPNPRFAILVETDNNDTNNVFSKKNKRDNALHKKEYNSFTSNGGDDYHNKPQYIYRNFESTKNKEAREKQEKENEARLQKIIEEKKQKQLSIDNFPDLLENKNNQSNVKPTILQTGFIDKVKFVKPTTNVEPIQNHIKPGWVEIKRDAKTRKIVTSVNPVANSDNNVSTNSENNVLNALAYLYERRTNEYIELWGYDEWEKTFRFPNYDYNYFNNLDELYEKKMEMLEIESSFLID